MDTIRNYLTNIFGDQVSIYMPEIEQPNNLPFYLASLYTLWKGELLKHQVYFAMYKQDELLTPEQYKKHMDNLRELMGDPVILVFKGTESYNRNRLIQKKVNFILENKQVFLPSLLVDLKDYLKPERSRKEYLTPAAQYLLLFHLQKQNLNATTYRQLSDILPYNYLTISRAIETLTSVDLCNLEGGKEKLLRFAEYKKEIWAKAIPYLINPVKKTVYINNELPEQFRTLTFINALAHYTNISDAPRDHFAINTRDFQMLCKYGQIPMFSEYDGNYYVELWKYPPIVIGDERFVDKLSLYLACRNTKNERIEAELETMIEKMPW